MHLSPLVAVVGVVIPAGARLGAADAVKPPLPPRPPWVPAAAVEDGGGH